MTVKLPRDANGCPIQVLKPINGVNKATTETFLNAHGDDGGDNDTLSVVVRVVATDADATMIISEDGTTSGDGIFLPMGLPEYFHIPLGWSAYVSGATVNFSPCV